MFKHKFNAKRTEFNGRSYPSKLEANYASYLERMKASGKVLFYLEQVPFRLPGGVFYRLDFMEFHAPKDDCDGDIIFTETKGRMTSDALIKIKQVQDIYNIPIRIVSKIKGSSSKMNKVLKENDIEEEPEYYLI